MFLNPPCLNFRSFTLFVFSNIFSSLGSPSVQWKKDKGQIPSEGYGTIMQAWGHSNFSVCPPVRHKCLGNTCSNGLHGKHKSLSYININMGQWGKLMHKHNKCGKGQKMDGIDTKEIPRGKPTLTNHTNSIILAPDHVEMGWDGQRLWGNGSKAIHHEQVLVRLLVDEHIHQWNQMSKTR